MINWFTGKHLWLDNSFPVDIPLGEIVFPSVTHAMFASQTHDIMLRALIANTSLEKLPNLENAIGQPSLDWNGPRTMQDLIDRKFGYISAGPHSKITSTLLCRLVETGLSQLTYCNYKHVQFWGQCMCPKHKEEKGKNVLGGLIMGVRAKLIRYLVAINDFTMPCVCGNKPVAWFLYASSGKPWLKPICNECQGQAAQIIHHSNESDLIVRFERAWIPGPVVNVQRVHSQDLQHIRQIFQPVNAPQDDDDEEYDNNWWAMGGHPTPGRFMPGRQEREFKSKVMKWSKRVISGI